jgi:hypothetical protein
MAAVLQVRPVRVLVTAGGGNDRANSVALIIVHTLRLCVLLQVVVGVCIGFLAKVSGGFGVGPGIGTVREDPGDRWAECPVDLLQCGIAPLVLGRVMQDLTMAWSSSLPCSKTSAETAMRCVEWRIVVPLRLQGVDVLQRMIKERSEQEVVPIEGGNKKLQ